MTSSSSLLPSLWIRVPIAVYSGSSTFGAVGLLGGDRHPHRSTGPLHIFAVVLGQVFAVFVEYRQAHDVEVHVDVADLLDLEDPA